MFHAVAEGLLRSDFVDVVVAVYNLDELTQAMATGNSIGRRFTSAGIRQQFLYLLFEKLAQRCIRTDTDPTRLKRWTARIFWLGFRDWR